MKLSLEWIKDFVKIPNDFDLSRLAYDLTMSTVEVEDVIKLEKQFDKMVVGIITEVLPHPNADKLKICKTDIGNKNIVDIVCGGSNLKKDMKVVVALEGAMVRWHGEGDLVEIKNVKLRGVDSFGMICASTEIGLADLFPCKEEKSIMDLSSFDSDEGTPIAKALDLDDVILEIDNKSMTNRPDLWGHYGIAREISALYDFPLLTIESISLDIKSDFNIEIDNKEKCPRYIGVKIEGLEVKESPYKMQNRIWKVGMRPINALVDVTNYVMLAIGQPTHAFDSDVISGHITVRSAKDDEKLLLLNDEELTLSSKDLVIADNEGAVALAGIMGGAKDSILPSTKNVILEIANFKAQGIRETSLRYNLRTEASGRFEKGIDPERCDITLSVAVKLFKELYPSMNVVGFCDVYPNKIECTKIDVELKLIEKYLGKKISNECMKKKLELLGFSVIFDSEMLHVVSPSWRSTGDISIKADIIEEIARMYGYENFEPMPITTTFNNAINQTKIDLIRKIKEYLAFRSGMQEIFSYPWMSDDCMNAILENTNNVFKLSVPPSPTESYIRSSLLPNICKAIAKNERYFNEFSIFEEAQIFKDCDYHAPYDKRELLPSQHVNIAGAFVCNLNNIMALFRKAKGIIEEMPRYTHMKSFTFKKVEKPFWADNTVWLNIFLDDKKIGNLGLLSKKSSLECKIKKLNAVLFEIDEDALEPFTSRTNVFTHLSEFPMTEYDLSLLFDTSTKWSEIHNAIISQKDDEKLFQGVSYVEEYKGEQIPDGKKSVTFKLTIGSFSRTLTFEEIEGFANSIVKNLKKTLGAEIREK